MQPVRLRLTVPRREIDAGAHSEMFDSTWETDSSSWQDMPLCEDRVTTWSPRGRLLRGNSGPPPAQSLVVWGTERT